MKIEGDALKKLTKARVDLLINKPFFGHIAMHMPFIESETAGGQRTTAVDENGRFYYNKEWVESMSLQDTIFELAHEVMHIVQNCMGRFPLNGNHALWNRAADYVVDTMLHDAGIAQSEVSKKMVPEAVMKKVRNKTTEQVYYMLMKEDGGNSKDGNKNQVISLQPGPGDPGPGVPNDHHDKRNPRACVTASLAAKKMNEHTIEKFKQTIIAAAEIAKAKSKGDLPGFINNFLVELTKPTITWRDHLRNLTASRFKSRYTFRRPNRREATTRLRLASRAPRKEGAIIMIDTSGSISDKEINKFISECVGVMDYCGCPWIKIYFHDVNCYHSELYSKSTIVNIPITRGGTSHVDVFEKVMEKEDKIGCVIAFTDLETCFPSGQIPFPVIWAHPPMGRNIDVPFGTKIEVRLD